MPLLLLPLLAALIQVRGQPLAGGTVSGSAVVPLERAAEGDTPVLPLVSSRGPVRLLLDTGAASSMVTPQLVQRLGLASRPLPPEAFALAGGGRGCADLRPRRTRLPLLSLGRGEALLRLAGVEALVLPAGALPPGIDGVLGAPTLRRQPFWIDPPARRLAFGAAALRLAATPGPPWLADGPAASATGASAGSSSLAAQSSQPLLLPLRWRQGVPLLALHTPLGVVMALADTGAEGLFISTTLAERLAPGESGRPLRLVGICGEQPVEQRRLLGLSLTPPRRDQTRLAPASQRSTGTLPMPVLSSSQPEPVSQVIVTRNPIFAALGVEAIVGQELLRQRRQLWRLDLPSPRLELR